MPRPKRTKITTRPLSTSTNNVANLPHKSRDETMDPRIRTAQASQQHEVESRNGNNHLFTMSGALQVQSKPPPHMQRPSQRRSRTAQDDEGGAERSATDSAKQSIGMKTIIPRPSEATNQEEVLVEGPFSSVTKTHGRISGRVSALNDPPPAKAMQGFEEHMQTSSPRPAQPPSGSRAQATPSFLQMSGFKRRARQPSLLQMVQQRNAVDEPESGDSDIDDSIRRAMDSSPREEGGDALHDSSASRKRKAAELDEEHENLPPSSPPNLRLGRGSPAAGEGGPHDEVVQVPAIQRDDIQIFEDVDKEAMNESALLRRPSRSQRTRSSQHTTHPPLDLPRRSTDRITSSSSPPRQPNAEPDLPLPAPALLKTSRPVRRHTIKPKHAPPTQRPPSPAITATPPASSSNPPTPAHPAAPSPAQQPHPARSKVKVTHRRSDGRPIPPPTAAASTSTRKPKETSISTATLRTLLPRRRTKLPANEDAFEMRSSSPAVNLDDSSTSPARPAVRKRQPLKEKSVNVKTKSRRSPAAKKKHATVGKMAGAAAAKGKGKGNGRIYGRRDQENDDAAIDVDGDEAADGDGDGYEEGETSLAEAAKSTEIVQAVKKFKEVDEWELSFESCDVHGGTSSPWR